MRIEMWSLAGLRSGETAHDFGLRIDLQNAAGDSVGHIKRVVWGQHRAKWTAKFPLPQKPPIPVEDPDARRILPPGGVLPGSFHESLILRHDPLSCQARDAAHAGNRPRTRRNNAKAIHAIRPGS